MSCATRIRVTGVDPASRGFVDREPGERGAGPFDDAGVELIRHGPPHVVRLEDAVERISRYRNHGLATLVRVVGAAGVTHDHVLATLRAMSWLPGHANDSAEMVLGSATGRGTTRP